MHGKNMTGELDWSDNPWPEVVAVMSIWDIWEMGVVRLKTIKRIQSVILGLGKTLPWDLPLYLISLAEEVRSARSRNDILAILKKYTEASDENRKIRDEDREMVVKMAQMRGKEILESEEKTRELAAQLEVEGKIESELTAEREKEEEERKEREAAQAEEEEEKRREKKMLYGWRS